MWSQRLAALAALPFISATTSPKRGLCHVPSDKYPTDDNIWTTIGSDLTWYYNYQSTPSVAYSSSNMQFVPMLWGSTLPSPDFKTTVENMLDAGRNVSYVLGFNEPDGLQSTGGSNMPADQAASIWKEQIEPLKARGVKLGAPAVTGSSTGFTWLENWLNACDGGCNPDFIPVHWYGNFEGLASHVGQVMGTYPNMTIWVTEWGFPNQKLEDTQANYNMTTEWFDRISNITHYSYFGAFRSDVSNVGPNSAMLTQKGQLTDIGSWYMGGAATNNIPSGAVRLASNFFMCWMFAMVFVVGMISEGWVTLRRLFIAIVVVLTV